MSDCQVYSASGEKVLDLSDLKTTFSPQYVPFPTNSDKPFYLGFCSPVPLPLSDCPKDTIGFQLDQTVKPHKCSSLGTFQSFKLSLSDSSDDVKAVATADGGSECESDRSRKRMIKISLKCTPDDEDSVTYQKEEDCTTEFQWQTKKVCDTSGESPSYCTPSQSELETLPELQADSYIINPCQPSTNCPDSNSVCLISGNDKVGIGKYGKVSKKDRAITVEFHDGQKCPSGFPRSTTVDFVCQPKLRSPELDVIESSINSCGRTKLRYAASTICSILQPSLQTGDGTPVTHGPQVAESGSWSVAFWLFFGFTFVYFVLGFLYKRMYWSMDGWDAIPNIDTFRAFRERLFGFRYRRIQI